MLLPWLIVLISPNKVDHMDLDLLLKLNHLVSGNSIFYHIVNIFGNNPFVRGLPIFSALAYTTLVAINPAKKGKIILELIGVVLAILVAVYCQTNLHIHLRPIFDTNIPINDVTGWISHKAEMGNRLYSLPSDTATCYFALSAIIFLENKRLGIFCFIWNIFTVGLCRIALGIHYPSDIFFGMILGITFVYILSKFSFANKNISYFFNKYDKQNFLYVNVVFIFSMEAYNLFVGLQSIYNFIGNVFLHKVTWLN